MWTVLQDLGGVVCVCAFVCACMCVFCHSLVYVHLKSRLLLCEAVFFYKAHYHTFFFQKKNTSINTFLLSCTNRDFQ